MSKAKQRQNRNILIAVAVSAIVVLALFMYTGYNPLTNSTKTGTSHTTGANIASTNTAAMTIYYSDGSHTTIGSTISKSQALSLINESPTAGTVGSTATEINTNLNMIPVYTGNVASYSINQGSFFVEIAVGTVTSWAQAQSSSTQILEVVGDQAIQPVSPLPSMPSSGGSVIVCSSTVSGSMAPFIGPLYQQGQTYTLIDEISGFSISGTFTDGSTFAVSAGTATCFWTYQYTSSATFTSVSVNFALSAS